MSLRLGMNLWQPTSAGSNLQSGRMSAAKGGSRTLFLVLGLGFALGPVRAMIFFATDDPTHNTTAPTGEFADSGWQWQGHWQGFTGTPVGTNWFLTAQHVGGQAGDELLLGGEGYRTTAYFDDPETDLRLWRVCRPFASFAPLSDTANEAGRVCVLLGRGLARGPEVTVTNAGQADLRGWYWGGGGGLLRWGLNRIAGYEDLGNRTGVLLRGTFDAAGGADEAMLTGGDSGGGLFIQGRGRWELAGIGYAVDGPFSYATNTPLFHAALFDCRGFYQESTTGWVQIAVSPLPRPVAFYASRISLRRSWIEQTMAANPEPATVPTLLSSPTANGFFAPAPATVDVQEREIRVARPATSTFFRLSACRPLRIVRVGMAGGELVLGYE
jgi:hypothetical protein